MTTRNKVLKYISGNMRDEESREFKIEMEKSSEIRDEFNKISEHLNSFTPQKEIEVNEYYFNKKLFEVTREKSPAEFRFTYKYALALTFVAILFVLVILRDDAFVDADSGQLFTSLPDSTFYAEVNEFIEQDKVEDLFESTDEKIIAMEDDLINSYSSFENLSIDEIENFLTESETEIIISNIKNKRIL